MCSCVHTHTAAAVFDLYTQWQSSGHIARPLLPACCTVAHCIVAACFPNHSLLVNTSQSQRHVSRLPITVHDKIEY